MAKKRSKVSTPKVIADSGTHVETRVEAVMEMLNKRMRKSEIKRELKKRFNIQFRQAENYLREAKNRLIAIIQSNKDDLRADSYATYLGIIEDPNSNARDKIRAQEAIDSLLGLKAPIKVAQTDTKGKDVGPTATAAERLAKLAAKLSGEPGESSPAQPG